MKIGILYSHSKLHPELLPDFNDGLKAALNYCKLNDSVETLMEGIGFGGLEKEVYEKAEKLLVLDGVDILVAYIDTRILSLIEPLIYSKGKLLIVINAGANYPEDKVPQNNIIFLTLHHSFLCWLTGKKAAETDSGTAAMVTSFYDAGYMHIVGMTKAYSKYGGQVRFNHVSNCKYNDSFEIEALADFLSKENETRKVLSIFDSSPAGYFLDRVNQLEQAEDLELFVSPMMLETAALKNKPFKFSIEGYLPYDPESSNEPNQVFRINFKAISKREASIFALQGWDLGILLKEINDLFLQQLTEGSVIRDALLDKTLNSPRGELKLDPETNYFTGPVYHVLKNKNQEGIRVTKEDQEAEWAEFLLNPLEGINSGWTNTYLCY